jgi:hypothetical protein
LGLDAVDKHAAGGANLFEEVDLVVGSAKVQFPRAFGHGGPAARREIQLFSEPFVSKSAMPLRHDECLVVVERKQRLNKTAHEESAPSRSSNQKNSISQRES